MMLDYARILNDFQRYDKSEKSLAKTERFLHYLDERILILEALRDMLKGNNITATTARKTALSGYELNQLYKYLRYFIMGRGRINAAHT